MHGEFLSFRAIAGLIALSLLPAIRRGASYVADNGSPWHWPLYPWSVFFSWRSALWSRLSVNAVFQNDLGNQSSFGGYYLVPFALAILVLIAEVAIVHRLETLKQWMLVAPWFWLAWRRQYQAPAALTTFPEQCDTLCRFTSLVEPRPALSFLMYLGIVAWRTTALLCSGANWTNRHRSTNSYVG